MSDTDQTAKVRVDKWLWAARFYKTRSLCKQAIEGGKVHYNGQRFKTSKMIEMGAELTIRCGWDDKTVIVTGISDQRRGATEAALLYQETEQSIQRRAEHAAQRKAAGRGLMPSNTRPTKKQRRQIHRFKTEASND
jgi:ribosome-associated heat shock protein Hsp15